MSAKQSSSTNSIKKRSPPGVKNGSKTHSKSESQQVKNGNKKKTAQSSPKSSGKDSTSAMTGLNIALGLVVMCVAGYIHQRFMYQIHENALWFSNIKEVEREISFRTESGLYYSYFKQVVNTPSFFKGVHDLTQDRQTEHPDTINVLARMNVYQEVVLAGIYRLFGVTTEPILFYINSVFALHGLLVFGLYLMTWLLSGSWLAALLAAVFYSLNRYDTTRVHNSMPLRECFSLPFIWVQAAALCVYFKPQLSKNIQRLAVGMILWSSFLFSLCWQFNQFVMMLQAFSLFGVWILGFLPAHKVRNVVLCQLTSLLLVCVLQFGNQMILSSWAVAFMLSFLAILYLLGEKPAPSSFCGNLGRVVGISILSLVSMAAISIGIKLILRVDSDEHISKFLLNKFGIGDERDFDSRLYLCLGIFGFITRDVFERLTSNLVLPFYIAAHLFMMCGLVYTIFRRWTRSKGESDKKDTQSTACPSDHVSSLLSSSHGLSQRPELVFHIVQAVFFGVLALFTLRMKYFWTPYVCVFAAVGISEVSLWNCLLHYVNVRHKYAITIVRSSAVVLVLAVLMKTVLPGVLEEMENLSEFWDPDTVELMEWISNNTSPVAAFTGSMQLLAGVKLCTGRPITNHPHYEDKHLRRKTKQLYQIYGRREPEEVHEILANYGSNYIILEDSICRAMSRGGCRLPDLIDIDNGHMTDEPVSMTGLVEASVPRFCEAVRHQKKAYVRYFKTVFVNRTFRLYKVL